MIEIFIFCI